MMEVEVQHTHKIKTELQPDGQWKAWAEGTAVVAFGEKKVVAIRKVARMILGEKQITHS